MRLPGINIFIENPFAQTKQITKLLKECALAFQQAMECIISHKTELALPFKEEVFLLRRSIEEHECKGAIKPRFFRKLTIRPSICYNYIRCHGRIALHMENVLEWILVQKDSVSDPLKTELFLLADEAGEIAGELKNLSDAASFWMKKPRIKNKKKCLASAYEILEKTNNAMAIARRTRSKILESDIKYTSMIHLMELTNLTEKIMEDSDEVARLVFFILNSIFKPIKET